MHVDDIDLPLFFNGSELSHIHISYVYRVWYDPVMVLHFCFLQMLTIQMLRELVSNMFRCNIMLCISILLALRIVYRSCCAGRVLNIRFCAPFSETLLLLP